MKVKYLINEEDIDMEGIETNMTKDTIDEAPCAYKAPDSIISNQEGIVFSVIDKIKPILNIKG